MADPRAAALLEYRTALLAARETEGRLQARKEHLAKLRKQFDKTEDDLKALQVRPRSSPITRGWWTLRAAATATRFAAICAL